MVENVRLRVLGKTIVSVVGDRTTTLRVSPTGVETRRSDGNLKFYPPTIRQLTTRERLHTTG